MAKQWKDLTVSEKLDQLYADLAKTMNVANRHSRQIEVANEAIGDLAHRVKALEAPKPKKKAPKRG